MEALGRLKDISRDWQSNRLVLAFELDSFSGEEINEILNEPKLSITARKHREKRSVNANSYFHVLASKISGKLGTSQTHEKNRLIREYGQWEFVDGKIPTIRMKPEYEEHMLDFLGVHVQVIRREPDSVVFGMMRGSHTYDTKEMATLIDGAVTECKELGIETLPPEELERMKATWKPGTSGKTA